MIGFTHQISDHKLVEKSTCGGYPIFLRKFPADQAGFTLVEIIAVLILLSVLAAVAVPRYIDMDENARQRALDAGISELNGREALAWSNIKITPTNWQDDQSVFDAYDKYLGNKYIWTPGHPLLGGGEIKFGLDGSPVTVTRIPSTSSRPGQWSK